MPFFSLLSSVPDLLGISAKDFELFRTLLKTGSLPASGIALKMGINRTTIFSALTRLQKKGLVYSVPKKGTTFFAAVDPENLVTTAKRRLQEEEENLWKMSEFVKVLLAERSALVAPPHTAFFEGEDGIIALFRKMLSISPAQEVFLTLEKIPPKILDYLKKDFLLEKKRKKVFSRILIPKSPRAEKYQHSDANGNRETRFVPEKTAFETEIILADSSIAMIDYRDNGMGVFIESAPLANTLRASFELLWGKG